MASAAHYVLFVRLAAEANAVVDRAGDAARKPMGIATTRTGEDLARRQAAMKARNTGVATIQRPTPAKIFLEQHYTVPELAALWAIDSSTLVRLLKEDEEIRKSTGHESHLFRLGGDESLKKQSYYTRMIPESTAKRIHERYSKSRKRTSEMENKKPAT